MGETPIRPRDLRQERIHAGVKQTELADEIGMHRPMLSMLESERYVMATPEFVEVYRAGIKAIVARREAAEVAS